MFDSCIVVNIIFPLMLSYVKFLQVFMKSSHFILTINVLANNWHILKEKVNVMKFNNSC